MFFSIFLFFNVPPTNLISSPMCFSLTYFVCTHTYDIIKRKYNIILEKISDVLGEVKKPLGLYLDSPQEEHMRYEHRSYARTDDHALLSTIFIISKLIIIIKLLSSSTIVFIERPIAVEIRYCHSSQLLACIWHSHTKN